MKTFAHAILQYCLIVQYFTILSLCVFNGLNSLLHCFSNIFRGNRFSKIPACLRWPLNINSVVRVIVVNFSLLVFIVSYHDLTPQSIVTESSISFSVRCGALLSTNVLVGVWSEVCSLVGVCSSERSRSRSSSRKSRSCSISERLAN